MTYPCFNPESFTHFEGIILRYVLFGDHWKSFQILISMQTILVPVRE